MIERVLAIIGFVLLVLIAWLYVRFRKAQLSEFDLAKKQAEIRESRIGWHPDESEPSKKGDRHVH